MIFLKAPKNQFCKLRNFTKKFDFPAFPIEEETSIDFSHWPKDSNWISTINKMCFLLPPYSISHSHDEINEMWVTFCFIFRIQWITTYKIHFSICKKNLFNRYSLFSILNYREKVSNLFLYSHQFSYKISLIKSRIFNEHICVFRWYWQVIQAFLHGSILPPTYISVYNLNYFPPIWANRKKKIRKINKTKINSQQETRSFNWI